MNYKKTLNLPKTKFDMRANLPKREPAMIEKWDASNLYEKILESRAGKKRFILHDGPPYANGNIHLGTALNKILKDIVVKSKTMQDIISPYVPGWDCHGLPIEHQMDKELGDKKKEMSTADFRRSCRTYASRFIDIQREEFKRLGVLGDWDNPYITMSNHYEATIAREFGKIVEAGGVFKGRKPVYWCASCVTALAEAEVEYHDHKTPSIFVRFKMEDDLSDRIPQAAGKTIYALIWTTTPWTIPSNLALAFHPDFDYVLAEDNEGNAYLLAERLAPVVMDQIGFPIRDYLALPKFKGAIMEGCKARHPFLDRQSLCVLADFVTLDSGTGIVHVAPGHGRDDYNTGLQYGLDIYAPVDDLGRFTADVPQFEGQFVFDANPDVNKLLEQHGALMHQENQTHQYPHCWRCKQPIIFRSTDQWFLSMEKQDLRKKALEHIDKVQWVPNWGHERIKAMMTGRPDWCLSRQRSWGIPIVSFTCKSCNEVLLDKTVIDRVADLFLQETSDCWFDRTAEELLPEGTRCKACGGSSFEKESDILDVWFDSGVSHAAVCEADEKLGWPVDLYLEGSDQHRGWFNSSLLTAVATRQRPPFHTVLTHGFVVTGEGLKMSKSLGNAIAPQEIIDKYGAEILRIWTASEDYRDDIRISQEIIQRLVESYRRIRNTCRFLLGNLGDFNPITDRVPFEQMAPLDRWILATMEGLSRRVVDAYNAYEFHTAFHSLHNLCAVELSSFYLDVCKDRLYSSGQEDQKRRSAQTAMFEVTVRLVKLLAPICSFTAEEVWQHLPAFEGKPDSVHLATFGPFNDAWLDEPLKKSWDNYLTIRREINKALEGARRDKVIGHSLDAVVEIEASGQTAELLDRFADELKETLIVSDVLRVEGLSGQDVFTGDIVADLKVRVSRSANQKCSRCWGYFSEVGSLENPELCSRCEDVLRRYPPEQDA